MLSGKLSGKSDEQRSEWWKLRKQQVENFLKIFIKQVKPGSMLGLVINPQYLKLLKLRRSRDEYEVEYFDIMELPEGLMTGLEIRDGHAISEYLKQMISTSGLEEQDVVFAIPRSSTIVKTITVDKRLTTDEIESRVWLEANRLFPNLIGEIYLDFSVSPTPPDATQEEVLIVACRKDQLKPYLDILDEADLNPRAVDVNYYAYERALALILKKNQETSPIGFLNINFGLIDLLIVQQGQLAYTHELAYDGHHLSKLCRSAENHENSTNPDEVLKSILGIHLKHVLQFFYSSRPNLRIDKIILGGDVPACIDGVVEYVRREIGKEIILADPVGGMKVATHLDAEKLKHYSPALMLCCGLALTNQGP